MIAPASSAVKSQRTLARGVREWARALHIFEKIAAAGRQLGQELLKPPDDLLKGAKDRK